ncbi:MAG TPA: hypothetical protein VGO62_21855, partial [Myxococcota bacterium]
MSPLAFLVALACAAPPVVNAPNPPPPIEEPAPDAAPPIEAAPSSPPTPSTPTPSTPTPEHKGKHKGIAPEQSEGGFAHGACWGATAGAALGACGPAAGTAIGASVLVGSLSAAVAQGGSGFGLVLLAVGVTGGVVIGAPSAVLLGPCGSVGGLVGALLGAAADDRALTPIIFGALPGLIIALASSV